MYNYQLYLLFCSLSLSLYIYPMRCARKAATVPNLRLEIGKEIEAR